MATETKDRQLTERQERFCIAYALTGSAAKSAREAGYEEDCAKEQGYENLTKPHIIKRINEIRREFELNGQISGEWVIAKLKENLERAMQAVPVVDREGNPTGEWKYDASAANKALQLLGQTVGLYIERTENSVPIEKLADRLAEQWKAMRRS